MKIGEWRFKLKKKEGKKLDSAGLWSNSETYHQLRILRGELWLGSGVTFAYACLGYQLFFVHFCFFAVLSVVLLVSSYIILEKTFGLGSSLERKDLREFLFSVCPDPVFLFSLWGAVLVVLFLSFYMLQWSGTGTYVGIFSSPFMFSMGLAGFLFSASFRLLNRICCFPSLSGLTEFYEFLLFFEMFITFFSYLFFSFVLVTFGSVWVCLFGGWYACGVSFGWWL